MRRSPLDHPPLLRNLIVAAAGETVPYKPGAAAPATGKPVLYENLGALAFKAGRSSRRRRPSSTRACGSLSRSTTPRRSARFARRQKLDPKCALCFWGEALILGPNINVPMMPEANAPALAALAKAVAAREGGAAARARADRGAGASATRPIPRPSAPALDAAYADAMKQVARSAIPATTRCRRCTPRR